MMQAWADYLDRLRAGKIEPGAMGGEDPVPHALPERTPACYVGAFDCVNRSRLSEDSTPSWAMGSLAAA